MEIGEISNELLRKAAAGDLSAFEEIYRAASGLVYNVALRVTCNPEDAEEAAQDVFLKVFEGLKSFKFKSSFKTWVYRITVNTALNFRKKSSSRSGRTAQYDDGIAEETTASDDSVNKSIDADGDKEVVDRLLKKLTPEYRAAIVLRELQGLSYEEIAETLDININTVRTRLKRARETLMKEVTTNGL